MQAKIKPHKSILRSVRYNEQKEAEGKARKIGAESFLQDHDRLTRDDIVERFRERTSLNERLHDHGVHFSLNFGKQEKLDDEKLMKIADRYMKAMGFEDQPYVVYRHSDAGHTHVHIVTTNVRADGGRVDIKPKDYLASCLLCKEIEKEFHLEKLVKATPLSIHQSKDHAQRVKYGEPGLKQAISKVLNTVVDHYKYTSLGELNAILKQYNVTANAGLEDSRLHKTGGLLYHALDEEGKRVGVPIKASLFLQKPTLKNLEQRFAQNQSQLEAPRERIHTAIDWALAGRAPDWPGFLESLERKGIDVVVDNNKDESVYFVDHLEKCVFSGKGLGAGYDLESLRNRCAPETQLTIEHIQDKNLTIKL